MNSLFKTTLVLSLVLCCYQQSFCQKHNAKKSNKILTKVKIWICVKVQKEYPYHKMLAGELFLDFSKKKHRPTNGLFQITQNEKVRKFDYSIKNDSIQFSFEKTKKWIDYEIISLSKKKLVLKQTITNNLFFWTFIPKKLQVKKKKRHPNSR